VRLSEESGLPVVAHVLPLTSTEFGSRIEPAVAAIFIRDREDAGGNATLLATTYELTSKRECSHDFLSAAVFRRPQESCR